MTQDTIKQRLRAARALIDTPAKWTQGVNARDSDGLALSCFEVDGSPSVVSRCAFGALMGACNLGEVGEIAKHLMRSINYYGGISSWNDEQGRTHAEVMQAFDRAITEVVA